MKKGKTVRVDITNPFRDATAEEWEEVGRRIQEIANSNPKVRSPFPEGGCVIRPSR